MNGKILYSGELNIEFLYEVTNGIESKNINLPFNFEAQSELIETNNNVDTDLEVEQDDFVIAEFRSCLQCLFERGRHAVDIAYE